MPGRFIASNRYNVRMTSVDRLRARLLHRIHRRYPTQTAPVSVGPLRLNFTRIEDPELVLNEAARREDLQLRLYGPATADDDLFLPYWAQLWDSALGLGLHLTRHWDRRGGRPLNVLDLGCGMGLAGAVAAALGHRVLLADLEPTALLLARLNCLDVAPTTRARRVDWRKDHLCERFDLILGSDILYERPQWEWLEAFWRAHLAADGIILLGEPGRQTGGMFPMWLAEYPWTLQTHEAAAPDRRIHIFELRGKEG